MSKIHKDNLIVLEKLANARNSRIAAIKTNLHDSRMSIHARIRERRLALKLSMEQLSGLADAKSWQTVQQWEREGGTAPKRTRLQKVAIALGVTPEWLMTGRNAQENEPALKFTELSGLEAQLVMLYRGLSDSGRDAILAKANELFNAREPEKATAANPYPKRQSALEGAIKGYADEGLDYATEQRNKNYRVQKPKHSKGS